ncbi:enterochelin esterase [Photobacterium atrarenae]|uniref:Enterochelin esterase n=1 Tax=Photobacterium atrarenae TaxID=865757 RepID=A0ABY5GNM0_9GAMM|nr:enterochelin esterase [Photobacterium atrarenae]UTV30741.1 enterochelin esterase [Photobacterium atrarenae]
MQTDKSLSGILSFLARKNCCVGDEQWWGKIRSEGLPLILTHDGEYREVLFLWREIPINHECSIKEVYIDINGVTDHHSFDMAKLTRLEGTDVWFYVNNIKPTWRGGYSFIPVTLQQVQPKYTGSAEAKRVQHRQWLRTIFPLSCRDEFSRKNLNNCEWGKNKTPLQMPNALPQPEWQSFDGLCGQCRASADLTFRWQSQRLNSTREIWLYSTNLTTACRHLPLVLILDGRFWSQSLPIYDALSQATQHGKLPEAIYVLVDEVNVRQRSEDLSCNPIFWQAVITELLPRVSDYFPVTQDPRQTAIVGQSLGGLAAMYAALHWPERFGAVVCQSGSFWWPDFSLVKLPSDYSPPYPSDLISDMSRQVHVGLGANVRLNLFLEVGSGEDIMIDLSRDMYNQLVSQQHRIQYRVFDGGHERLCWRGGIIDGLSYVFNRESESASEWVG